MTAVIALPRRPPPDPRLLQRCLLLAVLLHVWLVLVFGNAAGTAAPGEGVWGRLTVKLVGPRGGAADAPPGPPEKDWRDNGPVGTGKLERQGGQVRAEPAPTTERGAGQLGRWNPREVPPEAARTDSLSDAAPSAATLDLPEGYKPVERLQLPTPRLRESPAPTPTPALPAPPGRLQRLEGPAEPALRPLPQPPALRQTAPAAAAPLSADLPAPVSRLDAGPAVTPQPNRPPSLRPSPAADAATLPPVPELPSAVRRLEAAPDAGAAPERLRASELRPATAPVEPMPLTATPVPGAVRRLESAGTDSRPVAPMKREAELRTPAAAVAPPALSAQDLPGTVKRLEGPEGSAGVAPMPAAPLARAAAAQAGSANLSEAPTAVPELAAQQGGATLGNPVAETMAGPKASAGSPDAGSRLGQDLAVPPSASASAPRPPLNLSLPRGGDIAARRGPGLVDLLPQPPERKSKLEQSIEDATNKDCRKAYANAGILAAVPLAIDAARGKGCKW